MEPIEKIYTNDDPFEDMRREKARRWGGGFAPSHSQSVKNKRRVTQKKR